MAQTPWERRIRRAEQLPAQYPFAAEILGFLVPVLRFQDDLYRLVVNTSISNGNIGFEGTIWPGLARHFRSFLSIVEKNGPSSVAGAAANGCGGTDNSYFQMLNGFWTGKHSDSPNAAFDFLARAFLQPYAVFVRTQTGLKKLVHTPLVCPFCDRKPGVAVLRQLGDGGQRSLVCSFCLAEWGFRRILCPGCGEEDPAKLLVYQAEQFNYMRIECCDTCKNYIKTVDMTKNGLAEPMVDEMAAIPLDVWAQQQGYFKLQPNLLQL